MYRQTTLLKHGGMCARFAADRSTLIFTKDGENKTAIVSLCARWPPQSAGSSGIFPCPAIFSQVLIFSSCQGRSRQPPQRFQSSGLHANCLSIARLPPTYIMHLVSSAGLGLQRPSSLTFSRDEGWKSNTSGCNCVEQQPTLPLWASTDSERPAEPAAVRSCLGVTGQRLQVKRERRR